MTIYDLSHNVAHEQIILMFIAGTIMFMLGMYLFVHKKFKNNHPYPLIAFASLAEAALALHYCLPFVLWRYATL